MVFTLGDELDAAQGAGLILNYHTAYFSLKLRGRLAEGEKVLVHGAAGGVGTASIQVAKGLGASQVIARRLHGREGAGRARGGRRRGRALATRTGASRPRSSPAAASTSCSTPSAATASPTRLRSLAEDGRVVVVGFTGGSIPEVKVNRLLLRNTEVIGAGWGAYVMSKPQRQRRDPAPRSTS